MRNNLPKDIILFSTADWDHPFWTNKQHMAVMLARRGFRVLYLESVGLRQPTMGKKDLRRILHRLKSGLRGIRHVQDNIWVCSPLVVPLHEKPLVRWINNKILSYLIRKNSNRLKFRHPITWTYNPLSIQVIRKIRNKSITVYHCVDDLSSAPEMPVEAIKATENQLINEADLIFTTSPKLQNVCAKINSKNSYFFSNVVDFEHFSKARQPGVIPEDLSAIPRPRIGFIGAISNYKVDFELISSIARQKKDWHWVLIGEVGEGHPGTSVEKLKAPNIHLLGPKDYHMLPDYLRGFDVTTIPCPLNDYTASMFPMKFFEYLAAGKPTVCTNLPALQDYKEACFWGDSPGSFILAIAKILAGKSPDKALCLDLARKHTWEWRLDQMLGIISHKWERWTDAE